MIDTRDTISISMVKSWLSVLAMLILAVDNFYNTVCYSLVSVPYLSMIITFVVIAVGAYQDGDDGVAKSSMVSVLMLGVLWTLSDKGLASQVCFNRLSSASVGMFSVVVAGLYVKKLGGEGRC